MQNESPVLVGGEALYDLISTNPGAGLAGTKAFEKRVGGSPFNIAIGVRRLGTPVTFVGKCGDDPFGEGLIQFLRAEQVNVLNLSDEDLSYITGIDDPGRAIRALRVSAGGLVIITLGSQGAEIYRDSERLVSVPGFSVKVVETTGCGDSFMAATLAKLAGKTPKEIAGLWPAQLEPIARFANAAAAIVATRYGAAEANPTREEVESFLAQNG